MARLKVLVVDSFTGRGAASLPTQSLQRQANVVLHALLADLDALPEVELIAIATLDAVSGQVIHISASGAAGASGRAAGSAPNSAAQQATGHGACNLEGLRADCAPGRAGGPGADRLQAHVKQRREARAQRRMESREGGHTVYHATSHVVGGTPCMAADHGAQYTPGLVGDHIAACAPGLAADHAAACMAGLGTAHAAVYATGSASMPVHEQAPPGLNYSLHHAQFDVCMQLADAVWPLAFESAAALENLSRYILHCKRTLLGSAPGAVKVAASKLELARVLAEGGVATVATYSPHGAVPKDGGAWVAKPDDGAGCLHTMLFGDRAAALAWIRASAADGYVLQRFVAGKPGSLSLVCCDGVARVLSCNLDRVAMRDNRFHVLGSVVNGLSDNDGALERLAQQVAAAIPSLWGYVGVDFILTAHGAVVLDVNPRLTAAYAGLRASTDCNPAGLVLDLLKGVSAVSWPAAGMRRPVSVDLGPQ
jgi:predicted ATP-grasp superfamily ATP-dependent carboligase